jgi:hypothetical protein
MSPTWRPSAASGSADMPRKLNADQRGRQSGSDERAWPPTQLIAFWNMMQAREGNPTPLASRLRNGDPLSQAERYFLADLIEGKTKPRKPRPTKSGKAILTHERHHIVKTFFYLKARYPRRQRKAIISEVCEVYDVSSRFVYKLLREYDRKQLELIRCDMAAFAEWQSSIAHK